MQRLIAALCLLLFPAFIYAQRFGGTPPSVKWKQINTDSVRIIFPAGLDSQAKRVATLVHAQAAYSSTSLGNRVKKINIVLQNQTTVANGYVGLGPYRSEFYLTPGFNNFDLGSLPWADQLAVHEYRHVEQFNNFRNGISAVLGTLFGQEGYALGVNASVPDWFFEGDAVYNETTLSNQGRGRLPQFLNAYPALWRGGKHYSWMKMRNGSLKDYVPDHYRLGYLLVNYGYQKYGLDFWKKVTHDASAFRGLFYPFQHAIKTHAGVDYKTFRKEALDYYRDTIQVLTKENQAGPAPVYPLDKAVLKDYSFPYALSATDLVYSKTSTRKRPAFYLKDAKGEHRLRVRDISQDDQFSYRNGKIVYAAYTSDPRWRWRDYSDLRILDVNTGKQVKLTNKSKYFTPDISASGAKVAAVYSPLNGKTELHILDAQTGQVLKALNAGDINLFTDPKFMTEDSVLTAVRLSDGQMALALADLVSGSITRVTPPSFNVVGYPVIDGDRIFFSASYNGADNVFAIRRGDGQIYQITDWPSGNYFVNVAHGKMTWSSFTADGYQLQQLDESKLQWKPVTEMKADTLVAPFAVSHSNEINPVLNIRGNRDFAILPYKKSTKLFNFHSWRPYYEDPEFTFSLYGENVLNTLQTELYYLYNENDKTNAAGARLTFAQWFPYISVGTQYTFDRASVVNNKLRQWGQLDSRVGLSIPLSWASGRNFKNFNVGTNYFYRNEFMRGLNKDSFVATNFGYMQHFISWSQQVGMAPQHIYPRLGYALNGNYQYIVSKYKSWQARAGASLYLPGFFSNHSIVLTGAFQQTDTSLQAFGNGIAYSRGYNAPYFSRMWRLSGNYHFPLLHPDFGFANILYISRIRGNAFYDLTRVYSNNKLQTADQRSVGGEVYFDTRWWNQYNLTFGFRVSRLLDRDFYSGQKNVNIYEFILPVSIFPK